MIRLGRIRAFTVFELIIGMSMAAIVVVIIFHAYFVFIGFMGVFNKNQLSQSELRLFRQIIAQDVENAVHVNIEQQQIVMRDTAQQLMVRYEVSADYMIRVNTRADTFHLKLIRLDPSFESEKKTEGTVDLLVFSFLHEHKPAMVTVRKNYTSVELFHH